MNMALLHALTECETDIDGALRRFSGDEDLYISCLNAFLQDSTMDDLDTALTAQSWDVAFTSAHALKGLAGNMGFVPLFHAVAALVILIRAGKLREISISTAQVRQCYQDITTAIRQNCNNDTGLKGERA